MMATIQEEDEIMKPYLNRPFKIGSEVLQLDRLEYDKDIMDGRAFIIKISFGYKGMFYKASISRITQKGFGWHASFLGIPIEGELLFSEINFL